MTATGQYGIAVVDVVVGEGRVSRYLMGIVLKNLPVIGATTPPLPDDLLGAVRRGVCLLAAVVGQACLGRVRDSQVRNVDFIPRDGVLPNPGDDAVVQTGLNVVALGRELTDFEPGPEGAVDHIGQPRPVRHFIGRLQCHMDL